MQSLRRITIFVALPALLLLALFFIGDSEVNSSNHSIERVVSLAPSFTEIVASLGDLDKLVGVTEFCNYPPKVRDIDRVGGYSTPSIEAILALRPDLVIAPQGHNRVVERLNQLGIKTLMLSDRGFPDLLQAIDTIGTLLEQRESANDLLGRFESSFFKVDDATDLRVTVVVGRESYGGEIRSIFIAGEGSFYEDLIAASGAKLYWSSGAGEFPRLSREAIFSLQSDLILDLTEFSGTEEDHLKCWQQFSNIPAVKESRIYSFSDDYTKIPGPRLLNFIEDIRLLLREYHN